MPRTAQPAEVALIPLPFAAQSGGIVGSALRSSGEHGQFFADGFSAGWHAAARDTVARRNAVRAALVAKYSL
jgi:hypothetical protein